ncbi:MAG: hypothetical protein NC911_03875 [Candidatus Omnitrophica bacterium]|nr:hypothetical protein [Candidatus Omnitrophota bacterium]
MNSLKLKTFAAEAGADLVGIASVERFEELPQEKQPRVIYPETRSVIIIGRRITRGTFRGVEEGTNFYNYSAFGQHWLADRFLALTTFQVAEFLEDNGWEAVPLPNLPPEVPPMGVRVKPGLPPPNVMLDFEDAAIRAGLGEIGYCGFFLTREFGPRQRFQMILTDAKLKPNPIPKGNICPGPEKCQIFCPLGAIKGEKKITIWRKSMVVAEINYHICSECKNGATANPYHPAGEPDRLAAVCGRSCLDNLEKSGRVKTFMLPFRLRQPWVVERTVDLFKL